MIINALASTSHPIAAQLIPIRRCNLSCAYCNEHDKVSEPVPLAAMLERVDALSALGTSIVTLSGGEPLLHPDLDDIIRRIRGRGMMATLVTNGYLLSPERIARLNRAGLDNLQLSIDNIHPDAISRKSLTLLRPKLEALAEDATFDINVNVVCGGQACDPADVLQIAACAASLGFETTMGLLHDASGQIQALSEPHLSLVDELHRRQTSFFAISNHTFFQHNLARGQTNDWLCRAGSRFLYICEDGLVHYCSQQRGDPGVPLASYTVADLDREYAAPKPCSPTCTVGCVHHVAFLDALRERPVETLKERFLGDDVSARLPVLVRGLVWLFATNSHQLVTRRFVRVLLGLECSGERAATEHWSDTPLSERTLEP
jgi:MoaA/NifB/PqqE/SkfB family radical SAM enzyme